MKNLLIVLSFVLGATSASAQTKQAADSNATMNGFPVLRSYVAPDVVERAKKKYGRSLYCIEKTTAGANCMNSYLVGLIKNGKLTTDWMCDDPKIALHVDRKTSTRRQAKA
jgi:hypothetical protein